MMVSAIDNGPMDGQLSFLNVTLGQRVGQAENIGEIKVMDNYKLNTLLSEYYIDRIMVGLPASVTYQGVKYPEPDEYGSAGSFFMNPVIPTEQYEKLKSSYPDMPHYVVDDMHVKVPAGWLIDRCGWNN
jgi:hypothetical protein